MFENHRPIFLSFLFFYCSFLDGQKQCGDERRPFFIRLVDAVARGLWEGACFPRHLQLIKTTLPEIIKDVLTHTSHTESLSTLQEVFQSPFPFRFFCFVFSPFLPLSLATSHTNIFLNNRWLKDGKSLGSSKEIC